ncbi:MAG: hypothetical protein ABIS06_19360 [Vicinamibacterales bacterium]
MFRRVSAAVLAVLFLTAAGACSGSGLFGKQYEYEEDLTLGLDGRATVIVNASIASLVALRGLNLPIDRAARLPDDEIRALFTSPVTQVTRVSRPWTRKGRRFIQVRVRVSDISRLSEAAPFSWSTYSLKQEDGQHVFSQNVGASALKPGTLQNYGWDGSEIVGFRLHLPSKITFHNSRDLETNDTKSADRGNILGWEQHLTDRLDGRPLEIVVKMASQSILHRTLFLFAGAFTAAVTVLILLVWWTMRTGKDAPTATA